MKKLLKDNRGFIAFLLIFGVFRLAVADWNPVPSGSMRPTIVQGDVVLVNRLAYDLKLPLSDRTLYRTGDPHRGDVVTFSSPQDGVRLIKRLVAVPGDVVELRGDVLYLNGVRADYGGVQSGTETLDSGQKTMAVMATEHIAGNDRTIQFLPDLAARRSFGPIVVPPEHFFFLGDNRDNSADSRFIGFVPRNLLIGRAHHILVSADITDDWMPRMRRWGQSIQ